MESQLDRMTATEFASCPSKDTCFDQDDPRESPNQEQGIARGGRCASAENIVVQLSTRLVADCRNLQNGSALQRGSRHRSWSQSRVNPGAFLGPRRCGRLQIAQDAD